MRYREPFTLYPRKSAKKTILHYRVYDEHGQRSTGRSTGHTNPVRARQHLVNLIRQGEEIPQKEITFHLYTHNMRKNLVNHLLPFFEKQKRLRQITPADIDKLVLYLKEKQLANTTVNNIIGTLSADLPPAKLLRLAKSLQRAKNQGNMERKLVTFHGKPACSVHRATIRRNQWLACRGYSR